MESTNFVDQFKRRYLFPIYNNWGAGRLARGQYETAIADCTRAIELRPHEATPYLNRGSAHYQLGNSEAACR
ncbi:MAG: tetratricopeptide repeat protein, partial [Chloroflexota bacterium]